MLYFQERPDEIFQDIVRESLTRAKAELTDAESHPHLWSTILPKTRQVLALGPALATVDELLGVLDRPEVYDLMPVHRLLICDAVQRYCEISNRLLGGATVHTRHKIDVIHPGPLCRIFLEPFDSALTEASGQARTEALQLLLLGDPPWQVPIARNVSPWYRQNKEYPICNPRAIDPPQP